MITRSAAARKRRNDSVTDKDPTTNAVDSGCASIHPHSSSSSPKLSVRILRFHAVAAWSWNANDDVCGICQAAFEGVCPGVKYPGEDCPVVWYVVVDDYYSQSRRCGGWFVNNFSFSFTQVYISRLLFFFFFFKKKKK
jgi:hypothetical protein